MFERKDKVSTRLLQGITTWTSTAKEAGNIDKAGYLTKDGIKLLRRIRYIGSYDKWDMYDEFHLSCHIKKVWKHLDYARSTFSINKQLTSEQWEYLNAVVLLENLGVLKF